MVISNSNIIHNMIMVVNYMLQKVSNDSDLAFLEKSLMRIKRKLEEYLKMDIVVLSFNFENMARPIYDNFWDTKSIYFDFQALDFLQSQYNLGIQVCSWANQDDVLMFLENFEKK